MSYMECAIYLEHGACSCSTGVPGNVCPLVTFNGEPVTPDDGDMLARSDYRRFLADPEVIQAWKDAPDQRAQQCPICHGPCRENAHPFDPDCYCGVCNGF